MTILVMSASTIVETVQKRSYPRLRVAGRQQVADHRHRRRAGLQDRRRGVQRNSADRHERETRLSGARGGDAHHVESDGIVTRSFRDTAEHWSDRHVSHWLTDGLGQLIDGVRREADYRTVADDAANVARRQIVLSDMDAVGAGQARDIGAIVDDDHSIVTVRQLNHPRRDGEKFAS
jgi:hypothetical protein